jgi:hypothetical protein
LSSEPSQRIKGSTEDSSVHVNHVGQRKTSSEGAQHETPTSSVQRKTYMRQRDRHYLGVCAKLLAAVRCSLEGLKRDGDEILLWKGPDGHYATVEKSLTDPMSAARNTDEALFTKAMMNGSLVSRYDKQD